MPLAYKSISSLAPKRTTHHNRHRLSPASPSNRRFSSSTASKEIAPPPKPTTGLAGRLASAAPKTTETYVAFGVTSNLFRKCNDQAAYFFPQREAKASASVPTLPSGEEVGLTDTDYSWWHDELGLQPTFSTWSQVCMLHMYIILVRLRALESRDSTMIYHQHLLDHFTYEAEDKMTVLHNLTASSIRNKYLKDIYLQWRGILGSYDEGLIKGDAVLAAAIWRNLWKADENVDWRNVAKVVAYMRRLIKVLGDDADGAVLAELSGVAPGSEGTDLFRKIQQEESLVAKKSKGIDEVFNPEESAGQVEGQQG